MQFVFLELTVGSPGVMFYQNFDIIEFLFSYPVQYFTEFEINFKFNVETGLSMSKIFK